MKNVNQGSIDLPPSENRSTVTIISELQKIVKFN